MENENKHILALLCGFLCALIVSTTCAAIEMQAPEETFYIMRFVGAACGSTIAVIFKLRDGTARAGLLMFVVGVIVGYISARLILDSFGWENVADYWLAASGIGGALGYICLQILYSNKMKSAMEKRAGLDE